MSPKVHDNLAPDFPFLNTPIAPSSIPEYVYKDEWPSGPLESQGKLLSSLFSSQFPSLQLEAYESL